MRERIRSAGWVRLFTGMIAVVLACTLSQGMMARRGVKAAASDGVVSTPTILPPPTAAGRPLYVDGEVLVRTRTAVQVQADQVVPSQALQPLVQAVKSLGGEVDWKRVLRYRDGSALLTVKLPDGMTVEQATLQLKKSGAVRYAQPNYLYYPDQEPQIPNDPFFPYNYDLNNEGQVFVPPLGLKGKPDADIDAPEAWGVHKASGNIVIGVIDTGVWIDHPDLQGQIWTNPGEIPDNGKDDDGNGYVDDVHGWDFFNNDATVWDIGDDDYHGTHVAGTIGALFNNGIGSAGINEHIQIMVLKFIGPNGGSTQDAVAAIQYATKMGARLTTNSWGGSEWDQALYDAIQQSSEQGMLFVAAAGNDGVDTDVAPHYPSSYDLPNVISVSSSDWNDQLSSFSNYGTQTVDMAAPGSYILSTYWKLVDGKAVPSYAWLSGTSMATPHVSGVAALLLDMYPDMPAFPGAPGYQQGQLTLKELLMYSGDYQPSFQGKMVSPVRLNAWNAVSQRILPVIEEVKVNGRPWGQRVAKTDNASPVEVSFAATVKTPFSTLASLKWDFGDGGAPVTGTQAEVTHAYREPGVYVVAVTATDADGDAVTVYATVEVAPPPGQPPLALVVDDDQGAEYQQALANALQSARIPFTVTDPASLLRLDPAQLPEPVFWETGAVSSGALNPDEQAFLAALHQAGGKFFLTGQDILQDLAGTSFAKTVLHVDRTQQDVGLAAIAGIPADPISRGLGAIELQYPVGYTDRADSLVPTLDADATLTSPAGITPAVRFISSDPKGARSVFAAFEFAALPSGVTGAADVAQRIYHFLTGFDVNLPPVVSVGSNRQLGDAPLTVEVRAQVTDPVQVAAVAEVYWEFGDGSPRVRVQGPDYAASHTYTAPGVYQARLQAVDDQGEDTWATRTFVVVPVGTRLLVVDGGTYSSEETHLVAWQRLTAALDQLRLPYVVVNPDDLVDSQGILDGAWDYLLLWTTGETGYTGRAQVAALAEFLDHGGRLILSGQDELFNLWPTPEGQAFARTYLHVDNVQHDVGSPLVIGWQSEPITKDLVIQPDFPFSDWSDAITSDWRTISPFFLRPADPNDYSQGFVPNGLVYRGDDYWVAFTTFPLEAIPLQSLVANDEQQAALAAAQAGSFVVQPARRGQLSLPNRKQGGTQLLPLKWPVYYPNYPNGRVSSQALVPVTGTLPQVLARAYHNFGGATNVAPVILLAGIDAAGPVEPGTEILLVTAAEDVDGSIKTATVDWGDGTPPQPAQVNQKHAYQQPGKYTIRVSYEDNEGAQSVAVGQVTVAYVVTPNQLEFTLNRETTAQATLTVANPRVQGVQGTLDFQTQVVSSASWLSLEPATGSIPPGEQRVLKVTVNTAGLAVGEYSAMVKITTNDPNKSEITVPVVLHVADAKVEVTAPQAGDVWTGEHEIRWQAQDPDGDELSIRIEYSADGGSTWKTIVQKTENDGVYSWDTRQVGRGGDRFQVRVTATDPLGHSVQAKSGIFTIAVVNGTVTTGPNPAHDSVTFYYTVTGPATLYVYSISGELVFQRDLNPAANHYTWDLTDLSGRPLASGLYLFTVVTADGAASRVGRLTIVR
ncbi:MAG: S8 family serine peptidase [Limnochordaceae bacterium]|nr:S8 family serine peptidase [Limnochordaceae bacterium]